MLDNFVSLNTRANMSILNRLRLIAIVGQSLLILFACYYLAIKLPLVWLSGLLLLEVVFLGYSNWRQKHQLSIKSLELLLHIIFDSLILAGVIYFSGGPNNPFIYLLLLPIALAAQMLNLKDLMVVVILQLVLYSLLNLYLWPLEMESSSPLASFHLHLMGMWVNFILTVILIAVFGFLTRYSMVKKEKQIQSLREKQLKDEQILSLGIMSASAAHELGTPLATMAIIVDDLQHQSLPDKIKKDLDIVVNQITSCRKIIQSLGDKSHHTKKQLTRKQSSNNKKSLKSQLQVIIDNWLVYRPQIVSELHWEEAFESLTGYLPISVEQAVTNLLDNAADASLANAQDKVEISCSFNQSEFIIEIVDFGNGIAEDLKQSLGANIQESQKQHHLGWGVFLSNASIERAGGKVQLLPSESGGTLTRINLPESAIA